VNAYICYKNTFIIQKKVSRLTFQQQIVAGLIGNYREGQGRPGRRSLNCSVRLSGRQFIDWISGNIKKQKSDINQTLIRQTYGKGSKNEKTG
jgi:hypothetical protein